MNRIIFALAFLLALNVHAISSEDIPDQYPNSALYSKPVEVIPNVWSAIGATAPPTYDNNGHNNNLSFIVTGDGVVVVNGGAAYTLAKALHDEIKIITDQPVKLVININKQSTFGSAPFKPILLLAIQLHKFTTTFSSLASLLNRLTTRRSRRPNSSINHLLHGNASVTMHERAAPERLTADANAVAFFKILTS